MCCDVLFVLQSCPEDDCQSPESCDEQEQEETSDVPDNQSLSGESEVVLCITGVAFSFTSHQILRSVTHVNKKCLLY